MKRHHGNEGTGAGLLISKQACLKERNKKKVILGIYGNKNGKSLHLQQFAYLNFS